MGSVRKGLGNLGAGQPEKSGSVHRKPERVLLIVDDSDDPLERRGGRGGQRREDAVRETRQPAVAAEPNRARPVLMDGAVGPRGQAVGLAIHLHLSGLIDDGNPVGFERKPGATASIGVAGKQGNGLKPLWQGPWRKRAISPPASRRARVVQPQAPAAVGGDVGQLRYGGPFERD